jgi:hypothetical protein
LNQNCRDITSDVFFELNNLNISDSSGSQMITLLNAVKLFWKIIETILPNYFFNKKEIEICDLEKEVLEKIQSFKTGD